MSRYGCSGWVRQGCLVVLCALLMAGSVALNAASPQALPLGTGPDKPQLPVPNLEELAGLPLISSAELSPSGRWLAAFSRAEQNRTLLVAPLGDNAAEVYVAGGDLWSLNTFWWLSDDRLLLSISLPDVVLGTPLTVTRLVLVDPHKRTVRMMFKREKGTANFQIQDRVVSLLPDDPERILVQIYSNPGKPPHVRAASLETTKYTRRVAQKALSGIWQWVSDSKGNVRAGYGYTANQKEPVLKLMDSAGRWQDFPNLTNAGFDVKAIPTNRPGVLYAESDHEFPLGALYEFKVDTGEFGKLIAQHDEGAISGVRLDPAGEEIAAIYYSNELVADEFLDKRTDNLLRAINQLLPDTHNIMVSESDDRRKVLLLAYASDVDPHYYLFDRDLNELNFVASQYDNLKNRALAKTTLHTYKARDDLEIPAYVTLPAKISYAEAIADKSRLPFVVLPHGGPHARDFLRFDWLTQLIASGGYGVLQMNFRGSTGYGREFFEAGKGNWGQAMQDDVTDGTHWLVQEGLADPRRLCIVGGSYGGYAALMGAAKEPDLYQAAVSFNGVSDLVSLLRLQDRYRGGRFSTRFIGNLWRDKASLRENSPARRVDDIKAPVLLVHGEKDRVVNVKQSRSMYRKLKGRKGKAGEAVNYVELKDGDHYLSRGNNRMKFARELVGFLDQHCG